MSLLNKRIPTLLVILLLGFLGAIGYWKFGQQISPDESLVPKEVRITNISDNKFSVSWLTTGKVEGQIEWGVVGEKLEKVAKDDRDTTSAVGKRMTHHVTVSELQPNTQYAFRILSGETRVRFDNNNKPYAVTTGPVIVSPPGADSFYGTVEAENAKVPAEAVAYLTVPGAGVMSSLVKSSGSYSFSLSTARTEDLTKYITYDPAATVATLLIVDGTKRSNVSVSLTNSHPVPLVTMGKEFDYRTTAPQIARIEPGKTTETEKTVEGGVEEKPVPQPPQVLNVEPLANEQQTTGQVEVLNPKDEGEEILTTKPEFFGKGPPDTVISITVHSSTPYNDVVVVDKSGKWSWTPPSSLSEGEHTLTIAYIDEAGKEQVFSRSFFVTKASAASVAFEATPSASTNTNTTTTIASPRPSASSATQEVIPSPTPRAAMPATESGVPVTGAISPTLLTLAAGFAIMVLGVFLIAL